MLAILHALGMFVADLFKSRSRLEGCDFRKGQLEERAASRLSLYGHDLDGRLILGGPWESGVAELNRTSRYVEAKQASELAVHIEALRALGQRLSPPFCQDSPH